MRLASLFSFYGRVSRGSMWLFLLGTLVVYAVFFGLLYSLGLLPANTLDAPDADTASFGFNVTGVASLPIMLVWLVVGICGLSFGVRRCHDRDRSGWFLLLFSLPIVNIWGFIELYCLRGTVGTNRFGPDPLGGGFAATAETFR